MSRRSRNRCSWQTGLSGMEFSLSVTQAIWFWFCFCNCWFLNTICCVMLINTWKEVCWDGLWVVQNNSNNHHELSCWIPFPFGLWSIHWINLQNRSCYQHTSVELVECSACWGFGPRIRWLGEVDDTLKRSDRFFTLVNLWNTWYGQE